MLKEILPPAPLQCTSSKGCQVLCSLVYGLCFLGVIFNACFLSVCSLFCDIDIPAPGPPYTLDLLRLRNY